MNQARRKYLPRDWLSTLALVLFIGLGQVGNAEDWPGWRGPRGDGTSRETNVPLHWSIPENQNVVWKVDLRGEGHSSPVVWQEHLFLLSCDTESKDRLLIDVDRVTGKTRWIKSVVKSPLETKHALNSYASSTPATDGKLVYVTFLKSDNKTILATNVSTPRDVTLGSMVVAAYDFDGNQKWMVEPGEFVSVHGFCSCPVLYEDLVIVNGDHDGKSYMVALNRNNGQEVWRVSRKNGIRSYVTPIVRRFQGREQLILSGDKSVMSYDPKTGNVLWQMDGPTEQFVASMVDDGQRVFLTAGYPDKHILAIDPTGQGDVTASHIVWRSNRNCAYVPSPIVCDQYLLLVSDDGIASCYDSATGERHWNHRFGGKFSTSPVTANGLVYFTSDEGHTKIVRPGAKMDVVAENQLEDEISASPAISQGSLFWRTKHHLIRVEEKGR